MTADEYLFEKGILNDATAHKLSKDNLKELLEQYAHVKAEQAFNAAREIKGEPLGWGDERDKYPTYSDWVAKKK